LGQEQYNAPTDFPRSTLRGTFLHILDAEYSWRTQCEKGIWPDELTEIEFPTFDLLGNRWREEEAAMRAYFSNLKDENMLSIIRYTTPEGLKRERVLWHCLYHVVNHGTQHRSEDTAILTSFNLSPGDFDFSMFTTEKK